MGIGAPSRPGIQCKGNDLSPVCLALFPKELAGKEAKGTKDKERCYAGAFGKDGAECLVTALLMGGLPERQIFGSGSTVIGASMWGAPAPRTRPRRRAPARARAHARTHSHAAQKRAGHSALAAQRDELERQLEQPDLGGTERARIEAQLKELQAKMAKGGEALAAMHAHVCTHVY